MRKGFGTVPVENDRRPPPDRSWVTQEKVSDRPAGYYVKGQLHPSPTDHELLQYFEFEHLPAGPLQNVSKEFFYMARLLVVNLPVGSEKDMALRKLLEAKDCAVRAALPLSREWNV